MHSSPNTSAITFHGVQNISTFNYYLFSALERSAMDRMFLQATWLLLSTKLYRARENHSPRSCYSHRTSYSLKCIVKLIREGILQPFPTYVNHNELFRQLIILDTILIIHINLLIFQSDGSNLNYNMCSKSSFT